MPSSGLPIRLKPGLVSIYNVGQTGVTGIVAPQNYNFGTINKTWYNEAYPPYTGDSVLFKGDDIIQLIYSGTTYTLVDENKIKLVEIPPI
jgi:hypothetical protein